MSIWASKRAVEAVAMIMLACGAVAWGQPAPDDAPRAITGRVSEGSLTTLGLSYDLTKARIAEPKPSLAEKRLHGTNHWAAQGDVTADAQGLRLNAAAKPAWASPHLWSGLKNVVVTVRMKAEAAAPGAGFGIKFGNVWTLSGEGPRLLFDPAAGTVSFPAAGPRAVAQAKVRIPAGEWLTVTAAYLYEDERFEASLNGEPVLQTAMPHQPFDAFMKEKFGRPAPLTGVGVFADQCDLRVVEFSVLAGAPQRRIAVFGDSISQRAYWVEELSKALGEKITNLAIGGDSARMGLLRLERDVLPLKPEIVVLFEGSNDMGGVAPQALAAEAILPMVKTCRAAGIRPVVCELLPRRGVKNVPEYNAEIRKMAEANGVPLIAWHAAMLDPEKPEMKAGYAPDGVHTEQLGGEAMVKAIALDLFRRR